jgi:hypothetical protein
MFTTTATAIRELPVSGTVTDNGLTAFDAQIRHQHIAELAYYKAKNRGFDAGHEVKDWLEAESEFIAFLYPVKYFKASAYRYAS